MNLKEKLEARGAFGQLTITVLYGIAFVELLALLLGFFCFIQAVLFHLFRITPLIVVPISEHLGIWELIVGIAFFFCLHKISVWSSRRLLGVANKQNHSGGWIATGMYCNLLFAVGGYVAGLIR